MEAEKLRSLIEDKGIKQTWIARKLGITKVQVNQWVSGKAGIPEKYLEELKKLLGITENEENL